MPRSRSASTNHTATIRDVARAAGVSVTTVSNALNGRSEAMTADTLTRIEQAIADLGYRPSSIARSLVTRRTATIGVVLAEIETPLFLQALGCIEPAARAAGYNVLLASARSRADEQTAVQVLLEKQVDGLIVFATSTMLAEDYLDALPAPLPPVVLVNRANQHQGCDQINWNSSRATAEAVAHLAGLGHRRIALLTGPAERRSSEERRQGYLEGLAACGLEPRPEYMRAGDYTGPRQAWVQATHELLALSPRPSAIIAAGDTVAAVVLATVQRAGLQVPGDLSIVGCDDQPFCMLVNPALTTVRLPVAKAGRLGFGMLLECMSGSRQPGRHITLPCELVLRESTGPVP